MAYISPIEFTFKRISEEITEKREGLIMQAIYEQGIKVDRDELLKAMMYDRQQYEQGYADGVAEAQNGKWIPISEKLPNRNGVYMVTRIIDGTRITDACYFDGQNTWHRDTGINHGRPYLTDIIAWQPLPEPYKKEGAE